MVSKRQEAGSLGTLVRDVGRIPILGAEGEVRLAREIEAREIATWERIFSLAPAVETVLDAIRDAGSAEAPDLAPLRAAAARAGRSKAAERAFAREARRAAAAIRAADRDRPALDAVLAALARMERGEAERPAGVTAEAFAEYCEAARDAARAATRARNAFVEANLRLVFTMAGQFRASGLPLADLVQEGSLGLMTAVDRFDYRRGLRFSTYACWWIRHMMGRAVANKARTVRVPAYLLESRQRIERVRHMLAARLGRPPTDDEIAAAADLPDSRLSAVRAMGGGRDVSLDASVGERSDQPRLDTFRDPGGEERTMDEELAMRDQLARAESFFDRLTAQEADILRKRFALEDDREWTLREIAQRYGVTRERIRQVQNRALLKLRKALDAADVAVA